MASSTADSRLNFRVRPDAERRLRAAAAACDLSLTDFVLSSAEARAAEVLGTHTLVPSDYFDALIGALDAPPKPNDALRAAARRPRRVKEA